ncbi:YARHG domain-containing protein [Breznakiella homolactica]|uniref:YARHG domain-containing protein n=1 Tax=Breznakiella homolactica TaxID=2798577 RepID=A0A7T7XJR6_9SPIR|nr:YARHG domain-containing protein [Breznakiella homolactica]QQO07646.1 YARHG domain-containing protein [Breznakiella homolactica]
MKKFLYFPMYKSIVVFFILINCIQLPAQEYELWSEGFIRGFNTMSIDGWDECYYYNNYIISQSALHRNSVPMDNSYNYRLPSIYYYQAGGIEYSINMQFDERKLIKYDVYVDRALVWESRKIVENETEIIIEVVSVYDDGEKQIIRYYNNRDDFLQEKLNAALVQTLASQIKAVERNGYIETEWMIEGLEEIIRNLDVHGLRVFRNLIYANHGYQFKTDYWKLFFEKYMRGYEGTHSNEEAETLLSDNEKEVIKRIAEEERTR